MPRSDESTPPTALMIAITAFTHRGRVREQNEDSIAAGPLAAVRPMTVPIRLCMPLRSATPVLVADGMGGHRSGAVASRHVAWRLAEVLPRLENTESIGAAIEAVNEELFDRMENHPELVGMGSTVAGIHLTPTRVWHFNVGDSRVYRIDPEYLVQLSHDDNPGAGRIDEHGRPTESSTPVLTQAIGGAEQRMEIMPHVDSTPVMAGDGWLLCTDGLSDVVALAEIEAALHRYDDVTAMETLFERTMAAGAPDNISMIIVRIIEDEQATT